MPTVATLRVQDVEVTRERYRTLSTTVERQCLKGYSDTSSMRELSMLEDHLLSTDPIAWTYL